jgi:hypothetical protein
LIGSPLTAVGARAPVLYSVSGTIGQPDAGGPLSGGIYSLTGGFWSLLSVVQTPGSPWLSIMLTATNTALVSWAVTVYGIQFATEYERRWDGELEQRAHNANGPEAGFYRLIQSQ